MVGKTKKKSQSKKLSPVLDVTSKKHLAAFKKLMKGSKVVLVLVWAPWCGACHRFKDNTWNSLVKIPPTQRKMNIASIRDDMFPHTGLKADIKHFPTLMLVSGKDNRPATFTGEDGAPTNDLPNREFSTLKTIIETDPETGTQSVTKERVTVSKPMAAKDLAINSTATEMMRNQPPNTTADLASSVKSATLARDTPPPKELMIGGGLLDALAGIAEKGAPAALLAAGASVFSAFRNRTLKNKNKSKSKSRSKRSSTYKA